MPKSGNSAGSATRRITLSEQSWELLDQLARRGIYGRNPAEVAGRFIDEALTRFIDRPQLKVKLAAVKSSDDDGADGSGT